MCQGASVGSKFYRFLEGFMLPYNFFLFFFGTVWNDQESLFCGKSFRQGQLGHCKPKIAGFKIYSRPVKE